MLIFDAYNEAKFATHRHHTIHGICLISKFPRLQNIGPLIFDFYNEAKFTVLLHQIYIHNKILDIS